MKVIEKGVLKILEADEGKRIRSIDDVYEPAHYDEKGHYIEEHFPYYTKKIYLATDFDISKINDFYVEE